MASDNHKIFTNLVGGVRLDAAASALSGEARNLIATLCDDGFVWLNGKQTKKSAKVKVGDIIEIEFQEEKLPDLTPKNIPFEIIIDKKDYAVINKPAGLTVHPAPGNFSDTLVNGLLYAFSIQDEDNGFRPGIVHRLDKNTSGLLVIAKNAKTRTLLSKLFSDRLVVKKYLALCHGNPMWAEKLVEAPIARDKRNRQRMVVNANGKHAASLFKVIEKYQKAFLAEITIFTGRTHQIRVHAAFLKHPLIGDNLYGGRPIGGFNRQGLHSAYLSFQDPVTGEIVTASSPMPQDMQNLVEMLSRGLV